ncbi:nuclear transport factor 2 family protein [Sphingobacterium griseoflavum]|nr:nuclear transport factor 2 family protein [Sphingobacterium griseoflavum]
MTIKVATFLTAVLLCGTQHSFASGGPTNPLKVHGSVHIISTYLEAITLGSTDLNQFLFADDFEYRNSANNNKCNKKEYSKHLKANEGVKYDCTTTYDILDETRQACIAKATMQFSNFTRVDYVTLNRTDDGWKVSKVVTTYP